MGVVATNTNIPQGGVPDRAMIAKLRRGMAGCAGCMDGRGMGDLGQAGDFYIPGVPDASWVGSGAGGGGYTPAVAPSSPGFWGSGGAAWLQDLTRITGSIASNVLSPPTFRSTTSPSGSLTEIRAGGGINYPSAGGGPTKSGTGIGLDTTTMLLLGLAAMALFAMSRR